jgi:hypothetical protein
MIAKEYQYKFLFLKKKKSHSKGSKKIGDGDTATEIFA